MAIELKELREWLDLISIDAVAQSDLIAIDDGGLTLIVQDDPGIYIEIGGTREDEDDE
jgi:hypothetical protein